MMGHEGANKLLLEPFLAIDRRSSRNREASFSTTGVNQSIYQLYGRRVGYLTLPYHFCSRSRKNEIDTEKTILIAEVLRWNPREPDSPPVEKQASCYSKPAFTQLWHKSVFVWCNEKNHLSDVHADDDVRPVLHGSAAWGAGWKGEGGGGAMGGRAEGRGNEQPTEYPSFLCSEASSSGQ